MKRMVGLIPVVGLAVVLTACDMTGGAGGVNMATPSVGAGAGFSLALESDGSVWAWGRNEVGELGDGTTTQRLTPVKVVGTGGSGTLTGIKAISSGGVFSLALASDGSVWAWGDNGTGQLGIGSTGGSSETPVQVVGTGGTGTLSGVTAIAAGNGQSLALKSDGSVWAWGGASDAPVQVVGPGGSGTLSGVTAIADSSDVLALKNDGSVWTWGDNTYGQLGDGTTSASATPVEVVGPGDTGTLSGVTAIAAGGYTALALKADGSVWAWGNNSSGELGDPSAGTTSDAPVQVVGPGGSGTLANVIAIAATADFSLALKSDGSVWAWGDNSVGELGDGSTGSPSDTPVQVVGPGGSGTLTGIVAIAAAGDHALALAKDGIVWAWGENTYGGLGNNTTANSDRPVKVLSGAGLIVNSLGVSSLRPLRR